MTTANLVEQQPYTALSTERMEDVVNQTIIGKDRDPAVGANHRRGQKRRNDQHQQKKRFPAPLRAMKVESDGIGGDERKNSNHQAGQDALANKFDVKTIG